MNNNNIPHYTKKKPLKFNLVRKIQCANKHVAKLKSATGVVQNPQTTLQVENVSQE